MPNPFEAFWNTLKLTMDNLGEPQNPLHTGEVTSCWLYYTALEEAMRYEEIGLNTTNDDEIREMLTDALNMCASQAKILGDFMVKEGIPLPEVSSRKPKSEGVAVPLGAKLTDDQLANGIALKISVGIVECALGQSQGVRSDLTMIWIRFHSEFLTFGATLKSLMIKRGWLKVPPYYYPPGVPHQ